MQALNEMYVEIKPIFNTYSFQLKKNWKKLVFFIALSVVFVLLLSYLPFVLIPDNPLPPTQADYFQQGFMFLTFILIFAVCFFFGGIICSEYSYKTGHIVFPIINKYKLVLGKFLGNLTMVYVVTGVFYLTLGFLGMYYYGGPLNIRFFYSLGITLLYVLAISSFVTLFSSFMKNVNMTVIACVMILLIVLRMVDMLVVLIEPDFEPVYSLDYVSKLISYILEQDFPTEIADRYRDGGGGGHMQGPDWAVRMWLTPSIETGIIVMLSYTVVCLGIAMVLFKRKQL